MDCLAGMATVALKTRKRGDRDLVQGNNFEEGIYNATIAHLSDLNLDNTPDLLDQPGIWKYGGRRVRVLWFRSASLVSASLYPLKVPRTRSRSGSSDPIPSIPDLGGMYIAPQNELPPEEMTKARLDLGLDHTPDHRVVRVHRPFAPASPGARAGR